MYTTNGRRVVCPPCRWEALRVKARSRPKAAAPKARDIKCEKTASGWRAKLGRTVSDYQPSIAQAVADLATKLASRRKETP